MAGEEEEERGLSGVLRIGISCLVEAEPALPFHHRLRFGNPFDIL